ncbi:MAG: SGNH/GDSL hydrolase family protein [Bacteroidales bacterium]
MNSSPTSSSASRRRFLQTVALGGVAALSLPQLISAAMPPAAKKKIKLREGDVILFQGDSITDSGRNKQNNAPNNGNALGNGYPFLTASFLLNKYANLNLSIYNKGISGNKVHQLAERWDKDCLELKPTVMSIMIGVNDFWHTLNGSYKGTPEIYEKDYIALLERTRTALPNLQLICIEPYAVKAAGGAVNDQWYPVFNEYREAAARVAKAYADLFIPMQSIFDKVQPLASDKHWTGDGVHPSLAGASLLSETWLATLK